MEHSYTLAEIRQGTGFAKDARFVLAPAPTTPEDEARAERYRAMATDDYVSEGSIEIDSDAIVSYSDDGGAYVAAWVWVDCSEVNECKCGASLEDGNDECGACADATEKDNKPVGF